MRRGRDSKDAKGQQKIPSMGTMQRLRATGWPRMYTLMLCLQRRMRRAYGGQGFSKEFARTAAYYAEVRRASGRGLGLMGCSIKIIFCYH